MIVEVISNPLYHPYDCLMGFETTRFCKNKHLDVKPVPHCPYRVKRGGP